MTSIRHSSSPAQRQWNTQAETVSCLRSNSILLVFQWRQGFRSPQGHSKGQPQLQLCIPTVFFQQVPVTSRMEFCNVPIVQHVLRDLKVERNRDELGGLL